MTFNEAVVEQALDKLFKGNYFDICTVDTIGVLLGVNPQQHPNYRALHALHCVHYNTMSQAILQELQQKVIECLRPTQLFHSGAVLAKALLIEGTDHVNTEDNYLLEKK